MRRLLFLAILAASACFAQNGFTASRSITVNHTLVPNTDQSNFPVLVQGLYPFLATVANGGSVTSASGYDVVFTSDSGCTTNLNWETDQYSTSGYATYWVQIPTLSHTSDTVFYVCYGKSAITTDQSNKTAVYDSNFRGVWHFGTTSSIGLSDSTSNTNTLTNSTVAAGVGRASGGGSFNGSSFLTASGSSLNSWTSQTISCWVNAPTGMAQFTRLLEKGANNEWTIIWDGGAGDNKITVQKLGSTVALITSTHVLTGAWHKIDVTITSGNVVTLFVDGVQDVSATSSTSPSSTSGTLNFGRYGGGGFNLSGFLDEVRISNTVRSSDWLATEYNSQSAPNTFYSVGGSAFTKTYPFWRLSVTPAGSGIASIGQWVSYDAGSNVISTSGGNPSASSSFSGQPASAAFNGTTNCSTFWLANNTGTTETLQYQFTSPTPTIDHIGITAGCNGGRGPIILTLDYSEDAVNFTTLYTWKGAAWPTTRTVTFNSSNTYPSPLGIAWRIRSDVAGNSCLAVAAWTMKDLGGTSITTTRYAALGSSYFADANAGYGGLDGITGDSFNSASSAASPWLEYDFPTVQQIGQITFKGAPTSSGCANLSAFSFQYSYDRSTWTTANSFTSLSWTSNVAQTFTITSGPSTAGQVGVFIVGP